MPESSIKLYAYQKSWLEDKSRFKMGLWCRQSGKSFAVSLEAVLDAVESGNSWVLLSSGERQSKELMEKCRMHTEAISAAASDIEESFFEDTQTKQLTIKFPNGARIIGLPANPDTARGFSANVILDEFAFHRDTDKIWTALFPTISRGFKLRIVSTPQGKQNRFYKLWSDDNNYAKHKTDIYQAVSAGLPVNPDELKTGIDDEDAWQQEYECQFLDEATAFLTYQLLSTCEIDTLPGEFSYENFPPSFLDSKFTGPLYAGVDIGRKKDLTVIWIDELLGDVFFTRGIFVLSKIQFKLQQLFIWNLIRTLKIKRTCIDATGIGAQLAEETVREFGSRAEAVEFTAPVKNDLATRTRRTFEDRQIRIPVYQKLRDDLHAVKKTVTSAGNIRFDAERTKDGHADRFWAASLALMASDKGAQVQVFVSRK